MPSFIIRDIGGKALFVEQGETAQEALTAAQASQIQAFRADPDNPVRIKLSRLLETSGLSTREFARRVLGRDVRSLSRYLGGEIIPPELADQILRMTLVVSPTSIQMMILRGDDDHIDVARLTPHSVFVELFELLDSRTSQQRAIHRMGMQRYLRVAMPGVSWNVEYRVTASGTEAAQQIALISAFAQLREHEGHPSMLEKITDEALLDDLWQTVDNAIGLTSTQIDFA